MSEPSHSKWSASGFEAIMLCPGKKVLEAGKPDSTSRYAAEGTVAHRVLTWCLTNNLHAHHYVGSELEADGFKFTVDDDMARHVQVCIDYVRELAGDDGEIYVDQRVNYSSYLSVPEADAWGTLDAAVVRGSHLYVVDFKYGMGVEVSAEANPQMSLYGLGMLASLADLVEIEHVHLAISQPRIKVAASEYDLSAADLEAWGCSTASSAVATCINAHSTYPDAAQGADGGWAETFLRPTEKACKFCRAKATCPALRSQVALVAYAANPASPEEFEQMGGLPDQHLANDSADWLATCLSKVDLIEDWCSAVRAEAHRRLTAGEPVPGFKLVQDKRGSRTWADAAQAEETLKTYRLKTEEMYDLKLISPTSAEKLAKAKVIGPRQWPKLQTLITQSEGKPAVAPASDPRPAIIVQPVDEAFEALADDIC